MKNKNCELLYDFYAFGNGVVAFVDRWSSEYQLTYHIIHSLGFPTQDDEFGEWKIYMEIKNDKNADVHNNELLHNTFHDLSYTSGF